MIRDINNIDDDIIRKKRIIAEMLYSDPDIIEVLDNKELDPMMMYFCMGMGGNNQQINPMMMYMLMGDKGKNSDDLFKMMAISNMMGNKNPI